MTRLVTWGCWGLLVLVLTSCASPQTHVLRAAVNHETQAVVAQHLGQPSEVWPLADGETLWSYRANQNIWAYWHTGYANGQPGRAHGGRSRPDALAEGTLHGICVAV